MRTFSSERYDIWCIRGSGHNAPVVNGHEQRASADRARDVRATASGDREAFSADLAPCYPPETGLRRALRTVDFERRAQRITIDDLIEGDGPLSVVTIWYATEEPRAGRFKLDFPGAEVALAEFPLEDPGLRKAWRTDRLWRITATVRGVGSVAAKLIIT